MLSRMQKFTRRKQKDGMIRNCHPVFEPGQKVLLFNSRPKLFPGKLKSRWRGPYVITSVSPYGYVELHDNESNKKFIVNGQRVKHYLEGNFEQECSKLRLD